MNSATIVMYHYVRPIEGSLYPGIKGLELDAFVRQLDHLEEIYNFITVDDLVSATKGGCALPENACWLTFDDGYIDHHEHVLPELLRRGIQGAFFPPSSSVMDNKLLDVNAIHHILACTDNIDQLVIDLNTKCRDAGLKEENIVSLWKQYGKANRFDDAKVIYVKRLLQHALPENSRNQITRELFEEYVGLTPDEFSKELYMSRDQIASLVRNNMYVGSHGSHHYWLDRLSYEDQEKDIANSLEFLEEVGAPRADWAMCYPYGAYNADTLAILQKLDCSLGVTTQAELADFAKFDRLTLPRYDTNDFAQ